MSQLILGALALAGVIWLLKSYTKASPTMLARGLKTGGGIVAMGAGALLFVRGRFDMAVPLFVFGAGLAGWLPGLSAFTSVGRRPTPGKRSRIASRFLDMELDLDTGQMTGRVLAGAHAGKDLGGLGPADLAALYRETSSDPDSRSLLEAYLDRRAPGWREAFQQDPAARAGEGRRRTNAMSEEEAYEILGVQPGADTDTIRRAHRSLMKKLHPDQGGSTYLATRVNEARDLLLGRHQ